MNIIQRYSGKIRVKKMGKRKETGFQGNGKLERLFFKNMEGPVKSPGSGITVWGRSPTFMRYGRIVICQFCFVGILD